MKQFNNARKVTIHKNFAEIGQYPKKKFQWDTGNERVL